MNLVCQAEILLAARNLSLHEIRKHVEFFDGFLALLCDFGGAPSKLGIPRGEERGRGVMLADALEERVALLEQAIVGQELMIVGGARLRDFAVEEVADALSKEPRLPRPAARQLRRSEIFCRSLCIYRQSCERQKHRGTFFESVSEVLICTDMLSTRSAFLNIS